jgi:hypothetical protein
MATFGEVTFMILDLLKERSDDAFYTEDHVIFLASHMRALLLERKYKATRNSTFVTQSEANRQQICLDLELTDVLPYGCSGRWLKSTAKIPETLSISDSRVTTVNDLMGSMVSFIPPERMPYVGYNKWLQNIIYASKSADGYLYLKSNNAQFVNLEKVQFSGVFSKPEEAAKLSCEQGSGSGSGSCDIMDKTFPLEDALLPQCIEMVVQELAGPRYAPDDTVNDDRDNLSGIAARTRVPSPAQRSTDEVLREEQQQQ